jgi:hypothetical protein
MVTKVVTTLILTVVLVMGLPTVPAFAAGQESQLDDLLIYGVACTSDGAFSADGFASKVGEDTEGVVVAIDFEGICPDGQILTLTHTQSADLCALLNPNARPNGKSRGKSGGYSWSVSDVIATIPELGPVIWSAIHIKVTLTNKSRSVVKETDLPLPCSPF